MATPSPEHQPSPAPTTQGQRLRRSYEEFLAWADEDVHVAWVDGEVIAREQVTPTGLPACPDGKSLAVFLAPKGARNCDCYLNVLQLHRQP
jgi:hypothetical protein